ncbi:MAG: hypothetical protein JO349_05270 [Candidatus Eremiobacteraeota bacterium]|nr:hypothetical protein [Candidatus Eremiobacteraeota bacterium]MBV8722409.1 hypothetical protein [Candidatus Eremiobacteraeota bacterium]
MMQRTVLLLAFAAIVAGCGSQTYTVNTPVLLNTSGSTLLNGGTSNLTATFAPPLGGSIVVTVNQATSTSSTVFTAAPAAGCTGVVTVAGSASATTANGPTGTFTITSVAVAPAGTCTIAITSTAGGPGATITVDTSGA